MIARTTGSAASHPGLLCSVALAASLAFGPATADGGRGDVDRMGAASPLAGGVQDMTTMPGGDWRAVRLADKPGLYFISANGRFVVKGEMFDIWRGRRVETYDQAVEAATRVGFDGLGAVWPDLKGVEIGVPGEEAPLIVFTDPRCPYCRKLIDDLASVRKRRSVIVLEIPLLGGASEADVRMLHCAADKGAARRSLLEHDSRRTLSQEPGCDAGPLQRRLVTAQMIGVRAVPFMIDGRDGRFIEGAPPDLDRWLSDGDAS